MRKGFEVNGDYRLMDSSELVYILTNSAVMVNKVRKRKWFMAKSAALRMSWRK